MAVVLVGGTVLFMLLGERLIPDFNHGVLLAILLVTTVLRALYMLNISTTKGYENFRATATIAVIGAPLNLLLILVVWWLDGPMEWFLGTYTVSSLVFWWLSRRQVAPLTPDRTRVGVGQGVSVLVVVGGLRTFRKKHTQET